MFAVRTSDKCFTEGHYDNMNDLIHHWWFELASKTHYWVRVDI